MQIRRIVLQFFNGQYLGRNSGVAYVGDQYLFARLPVGEPVQLQSGCAFCRGVSQHDGFIHIRVSRPLFAEHLQRAAVGYSECFPAEIVITIFLITIGGEILVLVKVVLNDLIRRRSVRRRHVHLFCPAIPDISGDAAQRRPAGNACSRIVPVEMNGEDIADVLRADRVIGRTGNEVSAIFNEDGPGPEIDLRIQKDQLPFLLAVSAYIDITVIVCTRADTADLSRDIQVRAADIGGQRVRARALIGIAAVTQCGRH